MDAQDMIATASLDELRFQKRYVQERLKELKAERERLTQRRQEIEVALSDRRAGSAPRMMDAASL